jgi:predicted porin
MKKSLIALAVLAASGAAMAQSSVTLYGIADVGVGGGEDGLNADSETKMVSGGLNTSRWGVKGSEDLGGGLKAVFKLEQGFNLDDGTAKGSGFDRQAYVGLAGGFGEVTFGNTWTAMDDILGASNSGFDSALSASNNVLVVPEVYASNPGNTIKYTSPSFSGFSGGFSYSMDELDAVSQDIVDFSVSYGNGPIAANFAYQVQGEVVGTEDLKLIALNGSYDFGMAKLLGSYGEAKVGDAKSSDYQIGVDVPLSPAMTLSAGYAYSEDNAAAGDNERTGYGIAVGYSLSKRTTAYAGFRQADVKDSSIEDNVFAVGLRHTF